MSSRYILNTLSLVAGVFLVVASRVFTGGSLEWLAFGVSTLVLVAALGGVIASERARHLAGYGVLGTVATWSLIAALVFSGSVFTWLVFADAVAIAAIALTALAIHEVTTERVVHTLEVRDEVRSELREAVGI